MKDFKTLLPYRENLALHLEEEPPTLWRRLFAKVAGFTTKRARGDEVRATVFSERLVEYPLLYHYLDLAPGQKVLDFGCVESLLPLQLCSLGLQVTGMDFRPYPFTHTNFNFIQGDILQWHPPADCFDAVVTISVIEHVGLAGYGDPESVQGDKIAVRKLLHALKPGGRLYLTVPVGKARTVGDYYRVYDAASLRELVPNIEVIRVFGKDGRYAQWRETDLEQVGSLVYDDYEGMAPVQGVAFVVAVKK